MPSRSRIECARRVRGALAARPPEAVPPLDPDTLLRIAQESLRGVAPSPGLRSPAALAFRRKADAWRAAALGRAGARADSVEAAGA